MNISFLCNMPWSINHLQITLISHKVVSNSLWPHGLQFAWFLCPSLYPGVCSNEFSLIPWCCPPTSSSVTLFSSCPLSQHQGLFQWVYSWLQMAKVLELQLQSFQWIISFKGIYSQFKKERGKESLWYVPRVTQDAISVARFVNQGSLISEPVL